MKHVLALLLCLASASHHPLFAGSSAESVSSSAPVSVLVMARQLSFSTFPSEEQVLRGTVVMYSPEFAVASGRDTMPLRRSIDSVQLISFDRRVSRKEAERRLAEDGYRLANPFELACMARTYFSKRVGEFTVTLVGDGGLDRWSSIYADGDYRVGDVSPEYPEGMPVEKIFMVAIKQ